MGKILLYESCMGTTQLISSINRIDEHDIGIVGESIG